MTGWCCISIKIWQWIRLILAAALLIGGGLHLIWYFGSFRRSTQRNETVIVYTLFTCDCTHGPCRSLHSVSFFILSCVLHISSWNSCWMSTVPRLTALLSWQHTMCWLDTVCCCWKLHVWAYWSIYNVQFYALSVVCVHVFYGICAIIVSHHVPDCCPKGCNEAFWKAIWWRVPNSL